MSSYPDPWRRGSCIGGRLYPGTHRKHWHVGNALCIRCRDHPRKKIELSDSSLLVAHYRPVAEVCPFGHKRPGDRVTIHTENGDLDITTRGESQFLRVGI